MSSTVASPNYDFLTRERERILTRSLFRAVDLIENFFPNPMHPGQPLVLDTSQKDLIDCIQFGFPLRLFKFSEIEGVILPKGVICIWPRQVGKSQSTAWAIAALMIILAPFRAGIVAASEEESQYLIDKVKEIFDNSLFKDYVEGRPKLSLLKLKNGSFCRSHTCSEKNIRGPSYHIIIIDESALMEEKILFGAALPTVRHGLRWVAITTPKGKKGKLIDFYFKGLETRPLICKSCKTEFPQGAFLDVTFPKDKFLQIPKAMPKCPKCGSWNWKYGIGKIAVPYLDPWNCCLIDPVELEATLDLHGWSALARQEWLGEIIDEASTVILKEWIDKNTDITLRNRMTVTPHTAYILGADYGRHHDASSFCLTHYDKNTQRIVFDYMKTVSGEFDHETDYAGIKHELLGLIKTFKPVWVIPDAMGLGNPLVEELHRDIRSIELGGRCKIFNNRKDRLGFIISHTTKPDLITNMIALLSRNPPALAIPPQTEPEIQEFRDELLRFELEVMDGGYVKYGTQSYHDDRVIAFALSLWGHRRKRWVQPNIKFFDYGTSKIQRKINKVKNDSYARIIEQMSLNMEYDNQYQGV